MGNNLNLMRRRLGIMSQPHKEQKTGDIITFDKLIASPLSVLAPFSPIQSLNGQSNPYPPGGGVNRWDEVWELGNISPETGENSNSDNRIRSTNYVPVNPETAYYIKTPETVGFRFYDSSKTFLGSSYNITKNNDVFTTPAGCYYLRFIVTNVTVYANNVSLNYPSTDHDYHPYSNICPIYGWTGCEVNGTGKNLLNPSDVEIGKNYNGNANIHRCVLYKKFPAGTYTVSVTGYGNFSEIAVGCVPNKYDRTGGSVNTITSTSVKSVTFTITDAMPYFYLFAIKSGDDAVTLSDVGTIELMLESGLPASSYSAYSGTTLSVNWTDIAGTVYGGTLQINPDGTGVLTGTRAKKTYTGSSGENWKFSTSNGKNRVYITDLVGIYDYNGTFIGNYIKGNQSNLYPDEWYAFPNANSFIIGVPATITSASGFKTYLSTNNLEICYTLATPVTYNLTEEQVGQLLALNGVNNVWSNVNEQITVTGWGH